MDASFPHDDTSSPPARSGVITAMERQKKNARRISIFLDGAFAFGIHQDILLQFPLYSGLQLEEATTREILDADSLLRAKETALSFLGHRSRTEHEVVQKLERAGFGQGIIAAVIERLYELSYLDDAAFTKAYIQHRTQHKGYGPRRIKSDLLRLGISADKIEQALEQYTDRHQLVKKAIEQAKKYCRKVRKEPDPYKKKQKIHQFLLRKGHTYETAREVLDHLEL